MSEQNVSDGLLSPSVELGVLNVHLMSGEDIVGQVWLETDTQSGLQTYRIDKPITVNFMHDPTSGQMRMGLGPLRPYLPKVLPRVDLLTAHVLWLAPIDERLKTAYQQFVSEIIVATPGNLNDVLAGK